MPTIFRRSWEKQLFGRNGAISVVMSARSGTDGAFGGSPTWSAPVKIFTSATGSFTSNDVGRLIRLTATPSNRYNGYYIIDSINSSTSVNLRKNHNIFNHPGSDAQFGEAGSSITWRISESCTFTTDAVGDLSQTTHPGSYVSISGATNASNNGLWRISQFLTTQTCVLSKSYIWYMADIRTPTNFTSDDNLDFTVESGLTWAIADREPFTGPDVLEATVQAAIDAGWTLWQQRGPVTGSGGTQDILADYILRSVGETDANLPEGKVMFARFLWAGGGTRTALGIFNNIRFFFGIGHAYDRTTTPGTSPGSGIGFVRGNNASTPPIATFNMSTITLAAAQDFAFCSDFGGTGTADIVSIGRQGQSLRYFREDFVAWGNADEFHMFYSPNPGAALASVRWIGWGHVKPIGQNPFNCALNATSTGGGTSSATFNTGTHDLSANGYVVGDRIYVRGQSVANNEYTEGGVITAFGGSNPNFTVTATSLAATWLAGNYGNAVPTGETYRGFVGADPAPLALYYTIGVTGAITTRLHNTPNLGNATGKDYDATNLGLAAVNDVSIISWAPLSPNYRTSNPGVAGLQVRYDTNNEFRGKARNIQYLRGDILPLGKKFFDPVNGVYWVSVGWAASQGNAGLALSGALAGPFSKVQAGVK